jgi:hypothetical protein
MKCSLCSAVVSHLNIKLGMLIFSNAVKFMKLDVKLSVSINNVVRYIICLWQKTWMEFPNNIPISIRYFFLGQIH